MNTRPPIVVVLGHVDHGKTTLLDYIRKTNVAAKEAGAITQHIGAYQVQLNTKHSTQNTITFIDTPGHEAFEKMRSRGASVADIAILVVAADDGVMPQTKEAIRHIKEAKIPLIVAINKIDLPEINLEKIKKQLAKEEILLEGYGGEVISIPVSAKTGKGIDDLLEMILLVAEMNKIEADPQRPLEAVVIESKLDAHRGPVASIIVRNGTLRQGDVIFIDGNRGKVRALINERHLQVKEATPGTPVEVLGLESVPLVGSVIRKDYEEKKKHQETIIATKTFNLDSQKLKIILKSDVLGTLEAIIASLDQEKILVINSGTGDISDGDVLLAKTTGATIIGFNVKIKPSVAKLAETEGVRFKTYHIIYELLEELDDVIKALSEPPKEESLGKTKVIAQFGGNKGKIAGGKVIEGRLALGDKVKIIRDDKEVGQAKVKSLHFQKDIISKAELGQECGIILEPQLDFDIGDIVISTK